MKSTHLFYRAWGLLVAVMLGACNKGDLTTDSLTSCAGCEFYYQVNAKLDGWNVAEGKNRVFTYKQGGNGELSMTSIVHIEVPASLNSFVMEGEEIGNGKVAYLFSCPYCGVIATEPVDGFIQGQKVADDKWLVDATVELAAVYSGERMGSIVFKQYFTPRP